MTPNQTEEAFFLKHQDQHPEGVIISTCEAKDLTITRAGDIEDSFANAYRAEVIAKYNGDWLYFFLDWKREQEEQGKKI
jgi:hypothetical protein